MADNIDIKDAAAATQTVKTTDTAGIHTPHHNVDAVVPGTTATALGKAEDAAHTSGDVGVMLLAVRKDIAAALATTDGDYIPLIVDSSGRLHIAPINGPLGRGADAASVSAALSTEDVAILNALLTTSDFDTKIGALTETPPATDTASSGLNGRLQRVAQRLTSLIALLPAALGAGGGIKVDGSGTALPVSGTVAATTTPAVPATGLTTRAAINISSSGDNTVVSGTAAQTIRVHKVFLVASGTVNLKFKDGAGSDFHPAIPLYAGGGLVLDLDSDPWFVTSTANDLIINLSAAVQVSGRMYYTKS